MKSLFALLLLISIYPAKAQQPSPSPAPQQPQAQVKPAPCVTLAIPKRIHLKVPAFLQQQINKQQAKIGSTVDLNGMIQDATAPKPCPPASTLPPTPPTTIPAAPKQ